MFDDMTEAARKRKALQDKPTRILTRPITFGKLRGSCKTCVRNINVPSRRPRNPESFSPPSRVRIQVLSRNHLRSVALLLSTLSTDYRTTNSRIDRLTQITHELLHTPLSRLVPSSDILASSNSSHSHAHLSLALSCTTCKSVDFVHQIDSALDA